MSTKLLEVKVEVVIDEYPDTSLLGEYTDDLEPGVVVRDYGEFYEKLPAPMERDFDGKFLCKGAPEVPAKGREYRGFRPYAGGEKPGTKPYYKYGMQDFKRMEQLNRGDWCYVSIMVTAKVSCGLPKKGISQSACAQPFGNVQTLTSSGCSGFESDDQLDKGRGVRKEAAELKNILKELNVPLNDFDAKLQEAIDNTDGL